MPSRVSDPGVSGAGTGGRKYASPGRNGSVILLLVLSLLVVLGVLSFWPGSHKVAEMSSLICAKCGSNLDVHVLYGRNGWHEVETNRQETVTFRGPGFDSCQHDWQSGSMPTHPPARATAGN